VEDVERVDEALGGRVAGSAPERPHGVRTGDHRESALDRQAVQRPLDLALARRTRRRERDELVRAARSLSHSQE
jgi:hypothetical protein